MAAATAYQWASMPKILFHFYVSHVFLLNHLAAVNILCYFIHFLSPKCPLDYCIIIIDYRMTRQRTMATPLKYAVGWLDFFPFKILRLFTNLFIAYYFRNKCFYDLVAGTRYYTIIYISLKHNCMEKNRDTLMLCVPRFLFTHFLADTKGLFSQKIFRVQQHRSSNLPSSSWHFWGL